MAPVNNYKYTIGEELECKLEAQSKYSSHAIMVLAKDKNKKSKGKTSKKPDKEWIKIGHIRYALDEMLLPLMKICKIIRRKQKFLKTIVLHQRENGYLAEALKSHVITNCLDRKFVKSLLERK